MNDQYVIPPRLEIIPKWMSDPEGATDEGIARDIISLTYWRMIDKRAEALALSKAKKLKHYDIKKPFEAQPVEVFDAYNKYLRQAELETAEIMGKDIYARARAMAEGVDAGFDLTMFLEDMMPQVQTRIALDIKEMGLLPYLEYNDSTEWLLSKRTPWDGIGKKPGIWYEIDFMVKYLIPTLEANGFPRDMIIGIRDNYNKARFATPFLREKLSEVIAKSNAIREKLAQTTDEEEKRKLNIELAQSLQVDPVLRELLEVLVKEMARTAKQGGLGVHEFRDKMRKIARSAEDIVKAVGYVYNLKRGGIMMISLDDTRMLNAIKICTEKFVDWHLGTPEDLAREVGNRLLLDQKDTI